ncbi:MAG: ABC-2 family transporter protein [Candidatus Dojkabacteria bacterium]|nr:MAG: ABC-2 family transporter protein [Candidatus Dojkabacteria bacterium]
MSLNIRRMFRRLSELIYSGNIETYLIRPVNFLWMLAVQIVADHLVQFLVTVIVVATFLVSTVGVPEIVFSPILIIGALTLAVVGVVIELLLATLVGLFAIWLEKAEPVWWIIDKFILILGGSYVPIAFFPEFLQFVAKNSPFGATRFFSLIFYPHAELLLGNYLIVQSVWVGVLLLSIIIVLRRGLHKLFINGS